MATFDVEMPANQKVETRIEWAGERYSDLCEGIMPADVGWFVWQTVVGWADLGTKDEKRQYLEMAKLIETFLRSQAEFGYV